LSPGCRGAQDRPVDYLFNEVGNCYQRGYCTSNARTNKALSTLHPAIQLDAITAINELEAHGIDVVVTEGMHSLADQQKAYASGASKVRLGYHNFGLAFDMYYLDSSGRIDLNKPIIPADAAIVKRHGFDWGGDWGWDQPHFERTYSHSPRQLLNLPTGPNGFRCIPGVPRC
jgi:peptidoglycan LD-endopeptidase CwlK